ncbi:hypothetical protein A11A3_10511 [Alcanivorax hongdengensis A-11-3]|uniref:DNA-3-methyladenine glycosylase II n=1 Tax=Alcanivorax hongdengensis A-11-3 TaxID=1177179 RepID=L0WAQ6_9GAMM|nr:AlkA N-terminal domain-containing protein [Alcanivorax hongdengensis]EKF74084.1 hypothetical protein A11A3_10511 [Alcanivorax hongdengensis A-11-3]
MTLTLTLPADFRNQDFLDFHRRDPQQRAECVDGNQLHKGLVWQGRPARLSLLLDQQCATARLDAAGSQITPQALRSRVEHMLGLSQPVRDFQLACQDHPLLGPLIRRRPGLRVPQSGSPHEALCWAIIGQQISVHAALSIRARLIASTGIQHASGLYCFPDARAILNCTDTALRAAGLSGSKLGALRRISELALAQPALFEHDTPLPAQTLSDSLLAIRGIGPWTVSYALLRGYGKLDGSLHGDVAVRRGLARLLGEETVSPARTEQWLAAFSPWRALVAAHLWGI